MEKYNKFRIYDGHNCDISLLLTFIGLRKGKVRKRKLSESIIIDDYLVKDNCKKFYDERVKNYKQMVSDFTDFSLVKDINTIFYNPIVIKRNDDYILCDVKIDEIYNYRFVKFHLKTLSNDICFHDYLGDIDTYIENEISATNGYSFFVNNKKIGCNNLKEVIKFYLKELKIKEYFYSNDNISILTDDVSKISEKYLKRNNLGKNLFIRNLNDNQFPNFYGLYLSKYGNFLYIIQNCSNPCEEYAKLLPTLENSYDLIKQYIILNQYLLSEYSDYCACNVKSKQLEKDYRIINFYNKFREGLLSKSRGSVSFIIKEFERVCYDVDFSKKSKTIKKYIMKEFKKRKIEKNELISDTVSKTVGEIYDKTIDKLN